MALNGTALGTAIVDAMKVANPAITGATETALRTAFGAIATAIVAHITANAVVNRNTLGVTTAAAALIQAGNAATLDAGSGTIS